MNKVTRDTWTKVAGSAKEQARCQARVRLWKRRDGTLLEQGHTVPLTGASRQGLPVNCAVLFDCCMDLNGEIYVLGCSPFNLT